MISSLLYRLIPKNKPALVLTQAPLTHSSVETIISFGMNPSSQKDSQNVSLLLLKLLMRKNCFPEIRPRSVTLLFEIQKEKRHRKICGKKEEQRMPIRCSPLKYVVKKFSNHRSLFPLVMLILITIRYTCSPAS